MRIIDRKMLFNPDYIAGPGEIILEFMLARNITTDEIANIAKVKPKTMTKILNDKKKPSKRMLLRISPYIGVSYKMLVEATKLFYSKPKSDITLEA